jgi:hypothetical protein
MSHQIDTFSTLLLAGPESLPRRHELTDSDQRLLCQRPRPGSARHHLATINGNRIYPMDIAIMLRIESEAALCK